MLAVSGPPVDFKREANGDMVLQLDYRVLQADGTRAGIGMGGASDGYVDVTESLPGKVDAGWQTSFIKLLPIWQTWHILPSAQTRD